MRAILCLVFIMFATPVCAGWMNMEETDDEIQYIDPDTIVREGELRKVWQLSDRKKANKDGVMSLRVLVAFHCSGDAYRLLEMFAYSKPMATGEVIDSLSYGPLSEWGELPQRSVKERIALIACAI